MPIFLYQPYTYGKVCNFFDYSYSQVMDCNKHQIPGDGDSEGENFSCQFVLKLDGG